MGAYSWGLFSCWKQLSAVFEKRQECGVKVNQKSKIAGRETKSRSWKMLKQEWSQVIVICGFVTTSDPFYIQVVIWIFLSIQNIDYGSFKNRCWILNVRTSIGSFTGDYLTLFSWYIHGDYLPELFPGRTRDSPWSCQATSADSSHWLGQEIVPATCHFHSLMIVQIKQTRYDMLISHL